MSNEHSNVVDLTRDEDDERPGTPTNKCSICHEDLINKCNPDSCSHTFCFECLKRWSHVQPSCPLCKSIFKNIYHSFTSNSLHETYNVPSREVGDYDTMSRSINIQSLSERILRIILYKDAILRNDTPLMSILLIPDFNYNDITPAYIHSNIVDNHHTFNAFQMLYNLDNHGPFRGPVIGQITRTRVYHEDLRAQPLPDLNGRFRDCSPALFRDNPDQLHRLYCFILRDILAIKTIERSYGRLIPEHELYITTFIIQTITVYEIRDIHTSDMLESLLGRFTEHFCFELFNYANSLFDINDYDSYVTYVRREGLSTDTELSTDSFNTPEEIDTDTRQVSPEIIGLSSGNSNIKIVNPPVNSVVTNDLTSEQPSTSTGIRNSSNEPNNRYNLRRRLVPSTLKRKIILNSSSSDEEF